MPPEGEDGYGRRSYGEPYPDAYGAPYGERDEDEPYGRRGAAGEDWAYATDQTGPGLSQQGYADREFQWAVDALADPLSDPLPGQGPRQSPAPQYGQGYGQQDQGYAGQGYVVEAYGLQPEPSHGQPHGQQAQDPGRHEPRYQAQQQHVPSHQPAHRQQPQQQSPHQPQHPAQQQESGQELQQDGVSPWFRTDRQPEQAWDDGPQQGGATQRLSTQRPQPPRSSQAPPPSPSSPQTAPSPQPLPYRQQQAQQPQQEYGAASGGGPAPSYGGQEPQGPQPTQRLRTQQNRGPQQWHADRAGAGAPGPAAGGAPLGDPGTAAGLPVRGQHRQVAGWPGAEGAGAGTAAPAATASAGAPAAPAQQGGRRRDARHRGVEGAFSEGDPSRGAASPGASSAGAGTDETAAMPVVEEPAPAPGRAARRRAAESASSGSAAASSLSSSSSTASSAVPAPARAGTTGDDAKTNTTTVGLVRPGEAALVGRAARRRAAQRRSRSGSPPPAAPGTRLEARRAERARRPGPAIIASRLLGEVFISTGVLMLLFVAYQLWWTNVLAGQEAGGAAQTLQDSWGEGGGKGKGGLDPERRADDFKPGEGFAIIYLPKLDVRAPIAQGISKPAVLDKGLVGHYDGTPFRTGMPWDKTGNFALAAHRNTHGEPFRYINRLVWGDDIVVETATKYYTYKMTARLPSTSPSNTSVIRPVPVGSGFQKPGRYITLTTCTPEFTSKYRLIVWGKMVEERPRSKGKPDALVE